MCRGVALAGLAAFVGGCALLIPPSHTAVPSDAVTGSIKPPLGPLADQEDRRRAKAALATALDPQGEGTPVAWDNPTSGDKGVVTPLGHAYPDDGRVCRAFSETTRQGKEVTSGQGVACEQSGGDWSVVSRKPVAKSREPGDKPRELGDKPREPAVKS